MADIDHGEIHLWHIDLADTAHDKSTATLSADELARWSRFVYARDRNRYLRCHVALRNILAMYLRQSAADIKFDSDPEGKPRVYGTALRFNLSHSADQAVVALTLDGDIGVDIEEFRNVADCAEVAREYFSSSEFGELQLLPAAEQSHSFLVCWTRKEALLKATGRGLIGLDRAEVGISPVDVIVHAMDSGDERDFLLQTVLHWGRAVVSVAAPTDARKVQCMQWPLPAGRFNASRYHDTRSASAAC